MPLKLFLFKIDVGHGADVTEDHLKIFSQSSEADRSVTSDLPLASPRLNWIAMPAVRRLLAMRRRELLRAFGALGQRTDRRTPSLTVQLSRACSSVTVPLNPSRASSAIGSYRGEDSSARLRASVRLER